MTSMTDELKQRLGRLGTKLHRLTHPMSSANLYA